MIDRGMIGVFGQTGSGKTSLLKELTLQSTRLIIWDSKWGEFNAIKFNDLVEFAAYLQDKAKPGGFFRVAYRPRWWEIEAYLQIVSAVGLMGETTFVCEEARVLPDYRESEGLDNLLNEGRHENVHMIFATPRPLQLQPECRAQLTDVYSFFQTGKGDIKALEDEMQDAAFEIPGLAPKYQYLHWNKFSGASGIVKGYTRKDL